MKKRTLALLLVIAMFTLMLTSCGGDTNPAAAEDSGASTPAAEKTEAPDAAVTEEVKVSDNGDNLAGSAAWYDSLGVPQYGGDIVFATAHWNETLDYMITQGNLICQYYLDPLFYPNWAVDRSEYSFVTNFIPEDYYSGALAESYEVIDGKTIYVYLRQNVYWHDKEPVNGRQFVASDVVYHFSRALGINDFEGQAPANIARLAPLIGVEEIDEFTIAFYFSDESFKNIYILMELAVQNYIQPREVIDMGATNDFEYAIGTGPWVVTDFVSGSSLTLERNPNYYATDERYPENQLPYADSLTVLNVADQSTLISYLRTGQVDFADQLSYQQITILEETGQADLTIYKIPRVATPGMQLNMEKVEAFADIRVRQALQMAIDRDTIAKQYYGLETGTPAGWVNPNNSAYAYAYSEWSDALKSEYGYDPERAKELLAEAGYPDFSFKLLCANNDDLTLLEVLKSYYASIGVDMTIDAYDLATTQALSAEYSYDAFWTNNTASGATPWDMVTMDYSTADTNFNRTNDSAYDTMVDELRASNSSDEVAALVKGIDQYVIENHWGVRLFPIYIYNVAADTINGYSGETVFRNGSPGSFPWARFWVTE